MGRLVEGRWTTQWYEPDEEGRFVRDATVFRGRVTADGSSGFRAEAGRYHLYVSYACPWAHRTLITRALTGLEGAISVSVVDPLMGNEGWAFSEGPGCVPDFVNGAKYLRDVYVKADARYTGRVTVPVLWDKREGTIVSNESREIMRMLDLEFGAVAEADVTLCPPGLAREVDEALDAIYGPVNNGVYRAGFATTQGAYEEAVRALFDALGRLEARLGARRYLCGESLTEADVALFTTLYRFDPVYVGHFKCNLRRVADYPNLSGYLRDVFQTPGVAATCDLGHVKAHYYRSHPQINPSGIVPLGPEIDLSAPHGRGGAPGLARR